MNGKSDEDLGPLLERLGPHARRSLEAARMLAVRLHADEVSPEHWLAALLRDEDCAATRAVLHAFADPETLGIEVQAQCAGIMVVGSERTLPFSMLGVEALRAARTLARRGGAERIEPGHVFAAAAEHLHPELRERVSRLPGVAASWNVEPPAGPGGSSLPEEPLFRAYAPDALRSLGAACRAAAGLDRAAIAPTHLVLGTLEVDAELRSRTGLSPQRVRMVAAGLDEDPTPLPERSPPTDERLRALLAALPVRASTLDVLAWQLEHGSEELRSLLRRQKVTAALVERCRGVHLDPDE